MANIVRFEELVITGILQFGEIDQLDIELLKGWLKDDSDIEVSNGRIFCNSKYISSTSIEDGIDPWLADKYFLNPDYSLESIISKEIKDVLLRKRLGFAQGLILSQALESFNSDLFILRKIKKLPALSKDSLPKYFGEQQIKMIEDLISKGYLNYYFNDDTMTPCSAFKQLYITNLGKAKIFMDDYKKEIAKFCEQYVGEIGLDILERYLSRIDLTMALTEILSVDNFNSCYPLYDDSVQEKEIEVPRYTKLPKEWRKDKSSLVHQLLTTCKENTIYLCYPNELLKNKIDLSVNDANIAWADIDVDTMKTFYDYRKFCSSESKNALDYIICALNGKTHYKKNTKVRYVAVMEGDSEDRYLLRGIIKSDDNGFYVLLNPLFKEYLDSIRKPDESPETEIIKEYKP